MANLLPQPAQNRPRYRTLVLTALASLLAVVLLAYRSRGVTFRWDLLASTLEHADWRWLGISILLILMTNFVRALRWQVMLRPFGNPLGLWRLTADTAIGLTAGVLLGRVGEVVRPYLIARQACLPFTSQAAAWVLERILDLLAVLLLCAYAFIRLPRLPLAADGYALLAICAIALLLLLAFLDPAKRAEQRFLSAITFLPAPQQHRVARMIQAFTEGVVSAREPRSLALLVAYTILEWAIIVGSSLALFHGFQATHNFGALDVLVVLAFMTLGSVVQVPGVGLGAQAASIVALTAVYGIRIEAAMGIAVLLWVVGSVAVVPFGLACAFHQGLNWSRLKLLSTKQIIEGEAQDQV